MFKARSETSCCSGLDVENPLGFGLRRSILCFCCYSGNGKLGMTEVLKNIGPTRRF